ncbi:MAG: ABC transporter substrate-binding protein, partial [Streptococcus sanguinis]|nr:ABC transporter substrate-binding protein [Streptococcus sanguinis]
MTRTERLKVVYKIEKEFEYFMKYFKKIMVLALAGLALASCVNPSKTSESASDGDSKTVTIGYTQFPENIDPAAEYNGWFTVRYGVGET